MRRDDELLCYLKNARDAKEHTISQAVGIKFKETGMANIGVNGDDGSVMLLSSIPSIRDFWKKSGLTEETIVHVSSDDKDKISSSSMKLNIVHNKGVSYSPPKIHLGKNLPDNDPLMVAKLGLVFYKNFVHDVEREFKNSGI
jgi:hypothetical protein